MDRRSALIAALGAATMWVWVSAQQEMLPRPGPGSGVTPVRLVEQPVVTLSKASEVRIDGPVTTTTRGPSFATKGRTLLVTWSTGDEERLTVSDIVEGGWLEVQSSGGTRYVNLSAARSVQVVR